ncbi:cell wall-binding repeat-containing protein [Catenulispora rubra]|uniref:cell wall-binding repeat-containing protein n=1 Tax=Catenulispora rubra TaxID=280293 RepID=UPI00189212CF|nr:cell wall-binding repeat-containing protein [Catenulispora rubra]
MSDSVLRRPLALTATIATSVAAAAGLIAPAANATTPSPSGTATLTFSGGNSSAPTHVAAVTGTKYGLGFAPQMRDLAWAPTGARAAWVDTTTGAIMAGVPGGAAQMIAPVPPNGTIRSHPTWIDGGSKVVWSEKAPGAGNAILKWAQGNGIAGDGGVPAVQNLQTLTGSDLLHPDAVGSLLVYQVNTPNKPSQIYLWDRSQAASTPVLIAAGWDPSISADGTHVAFVAATASPAGNNIYTVALANPAATLNQVTNGGGFENPVWTPDGSGLVFQALDSTGKDVDTMSVPAAAAKSAAYTEVVPGTKVIGLPAFQPTVRDHVERIAGADRLGTAIKVSQSHWATAGAKSSQGVAAKAVVLSRSDQFADALGGSALAAKVGGPLLLTGTSGLDSAVKAEVQRVLGPGDGAKTVYVLGGVQALSPAVANALTALNYHVQRVAGQDRFSTAVAIANTITGPGVTPDYVLVATGEGFADPLSAGAAAGAINAHQGKNAVVLLTNDKVMPQATTDYLAPLLARTNLNSDRSKPANFIELDSIGGQATTALGSHWIPAGYQAGSFLGLSGLDRYETSYFVARYFFGSANAVGLATGTNWADALSGGAEMGTENGPLLLVNPKSGVPGGAAQWLGQDNGQFNRAEIFGGNVAVPGSVDKVVGGLIAGSGGVDYPSNPTV